MTSITLHLDKNVEKNASIYFDKAKKFKKKIEGAKEALESSKKKLEKLKKNKPEVKEIVIKKKVKKEWYEKFRWFYTSEGLLVIGGRDATTNEIVIKKHTDKEDIVFHTDMAGSPFFVIKAEGKKIGEKSLEETAQATASFSRAWKLGLASIDVFYVKPEQVSKEAQSGEFMPKGAFMIRGKTNYLHPKMEIALGIKEGILISGPTSAIKKEADKVIVLVQGNTKASDIAKKIGKELGIKDMDEIIRMLPTGGMKIQK